MTLGLNRKWAIGCVGGLGILMVMAIALAILDRALSKGLAPIGFTIPFEVVQVHRPSPTNRHNDSSEDSLAELQRGDRLDLTVQHHAKLAKGDQIQETPSLGYVVARRNECLIAFPVQSQTQAQEQIRGYRTTTIAAYVAALYYDLRGGVLLLGHDIEDQAVAQTEQADVIEIKSESSTGDKTSQTAQTMESSLIYLLLDSRWCTWLQVYEGMAIASVPVE